MTEVVRVLDVAMIADGTSYGVQVCGRRNGTMWEGWIEFQAPDQTWLRTPRETTQPDRAALHYWAGGLSLTYLEGALNRALAPPSNDVVAPVAAPHFAGPARRPAPPPATDHAILDPFAVGAKGETLLRQELGALRAWHLRNIVRAYDLADMRIDLETLSDEELIELIVAAVQPA